MAKKSRNPGSADRARRKRATPPNNERRERVGQVLSRRLLDAGDASPTQAAAADFARRSNAISRMNRPPREERPAIVGEELFTRPMPRPTRAPEESMRPVTRPDDLAERAELRKAMDSSDAAYRASRGEAADIDMQGFAKGGMVTGSRAQVSGTKFSGTF